MKIDDSQNELQHRSQILHESDPTERQVLRSHSKEDERDCRKKPVDCQTGRAEPSAGHELNRAVHGDPEQHADCDGCEHNGFEGIRVQRAHLISKFVLGQPIERKRARKGEGDPGQTTVIDRESGNGNNSEGNGKPLKLSKALAQQKHGQQNRDQRVDEIAQRRFDHVPDRNAINIDGPVDHDHDRGERQPGQCLSIAKDCQKGFPRATDKDEQHSGQEPEQDSPNHDFPGRCESEHRNDDWKRAPDQIGAESKG